jgi:Anaphase-promoting complex, subunit 10 (APC10)
VDLSPYASSDVATPKYLQQTVLHVATMPRPARRAPPSRDAVTTPTRPMDTANGIAAGIPPVMLQTPPHAPFLTTPLPFNDARASIISNDQPQHQHNLRHYHTPTLNSQREETSQLQATRMDQPMSDPDLADDDDSLLESAPHDPDDSRQLIGLRDISSLATWTLSSSKPGCALPQLRHPSPSHFWQSDGPQPHTLTLHFFKLVAIVKMRVYLDFDLDESYTPTKMRFFAGMSEGGLVEFATWEVHEQVDPETGETTSGVENVRGWIDICLRGVGGRDTNYHVTDLTPKPKKATKGSISRAEFARKHGLVPGSRPLKDAVSISEEQPEEDAMLAAAGGDVLKCMVVQVRICENHQNGKDTHVRGFQVFARDENAGKGSRKIIKKGVMHGKAVETSNGSVGNQEEEEILGMEEADWMGEPEVR